MTITKEYIDRFNKLVEQIHQHVEMWIPDEQLNLVDSFRTNIIIYSFLSSFIHKNLKDLLEEIEKQFTDYELQIEDFMKLKERKLQIEKSVSTKFLFLIKDLDKELKKLRN